MTHSPWSGVLGGRVGSVIAGLGTAQSEFEGSEGACTTPALVFAGGARDDRAPEEEVSAGDGTRCCGVRANKGFYWKQVGSVTVVLGWLFYVFVGVFFWWSIAWHMEWWGGGNQDREGR